MKNTVEQRGKFSSSLGFVLAATGSAVGLGNLWKFPYVAGQNGGAIFVIFYIAFIVGLGIPIMLGEMAIGRATRLNPIGAYRKLDKRFTFVGVIGVICAFVILSYYSVIGGWVLKYVFAYLSGTHITDATNYYNNFISSPVEPILWHVAFMVVSCSIVIGGIAKGIERASKIMLPALFILILIIVVRSVTLEGGGAGIRYFLLPDLSHVDSVSKLSNVLLAAMGQAFFSLSLGMGAIITYGSYLDKSVNLKRSSYAIPILDSMVALLSGFAILPAVFAFGFKPSAGSGLLFETLPNVFEAMPLGIVFGTLFFILVFFAAVTSSVSLLEVVTSFCIDNWKMKRRTASILVALIMTLIGILASMSFGVLSDVHLFGLNIFDTLSFISDKILMPVGGFFMCIFVGHVWGVRNAAAEITNDGKLPFKWQKLFEIVMKYIAPAIILVIFITSFI